MAQKFRRKDLKRPDEFVALSHRLWAWAATRTREVFVMLTVATAVVLAATAWTAYSDRRAERATEDLGKVVDSYERASTSALPSAANQLLDPSGAADDSTDAQKHVTFGEVDQAASQLLPKAPRGIESMALLVRASARYQAGKYDEAISDYETVLKRISAEDSPELHRSTLEGLMYAFEAKKSWDRALAMVDKLPQEGAHKFVAMSHRARILAEKGDVAQARALYQDIASRSTSRALADQAAEHLALLEQANQPAASSPQQNH